MYLSFRSSRKWKNFTSSIFRIKSKTAPLGLMKSVDAERIKIDLEGEDYIIMLSDGIGQSAELEKRISALITTGEEDSSYKEIQEALKKQLNRRRHNKTGQIPALEAELQEIEQQLTDFRTNLWNTKTVAEIRQDSINAATEAANDSIAAAGNPDKKEKKVTRRTSKEKEPKAKKEAKPKKQSEPKSKSGAAKVSVRRTRR